MAKIPAFHSTNPTDPDVHHDQSTCQAGNLIPSHNRKQGMGGYRKCEHCTKIGS